MFLYRRKTSRGLCKYWSVKYTGTDGRQVLRTTKQQDKDKARVGQRLEEQLGLRVRRTYEPKTFLEIADLLIAPKALVSKKLADEMAAKLPGGGRHFTLRSSGLTTRITVVGVKSPSSAYVGAQAIVTSDGELHGWIGGGCVQSTARATPRRM